MTEDEHINELDQLLLLHGGEEIEQPLSPEEEKQAERAGISKGQLKGLLGIGLTVGYGITAPNWKVQPEELEDATEATMLAIEHYFPDIEDFDHPLLMVALGLAMPALPRLAAGTPMKLPKPEEEQVKEEVTQEVEEESRPKSHTNIAKAREVKDFGSSSDFDVNKLLEEVGA